MPSPRELSEMIVNAQYTPNSPNVDECVNELLAYLSSKMRSFPRKTAEAQIRATIRLMETKDERETEEKEKNLKKKNEILSFARLYLIHLHDLNSRKTQLSYELQIHFKISAARAEKIAKAALEEYNRIYSFAINHIPQYFETAALINPDELKEAILRNFSIEERVAASIAHKAVQEYREATNTTPEFQTYNITESKKIITKSVIDKSEEIFSLKSASTPQPLEETPKGEILSKSETEVSSVIPEVRLSQEEVPSKNRKKTARKSKLDKKHILILNKLREIKYPSLFLKESGIPKASFYRKLNQLVKWELILRIGKGTPTHFELNPRMKNSSLSFLVGGVESQSHFEERVAEKASVEPTNGGEYETEQGSTSKTAPIVKQRESVDLDLSENEVSQSQLVSIPSISAKPREKNETRTQTTSKIPSFEEFVANFDPHHIRSHDYLYICQIQRAPKDFREKLEKANWLESKEGMSNWTWYRGSLKLYNIECHFHIYTKKITIQILEVTSPDSFSNNAIADSLAVEVTAYLEDQYPGLVLYDLKRRSRLEVKKLHHAIPNHPIAIRAFELNYASFGERFAIDNSKDEKELEAHEHKYSTEDIDNYVEDCDFKAKNDYWYRDAVGDILKNGLNLDKTAEVLSKVDQNLQQTAKNQDLTAQGLQAHGERLDSLGRLGLELIKDNQRLSNEILTLKEKLHNSTSGPIAHLAREKVSKEKVKLSKLQEFLLEIIRNTPGMSRKEIAATYRIKRGSVNGTITRLKKHFLIFEHSSKFYLLNKLKKREENEI